MRVEALDAGKAPGLVEAIAAAELLTNDQAGELVAIVEALDAGKVPALDTLMVNPAARGEDLIASNALDRLVIKFHAGRGPRRWEGR